MIALRFIAWSAACLTLASCEHMKPSAGGDPYASNYGNDGHYNPYPNQGGHAQSSTPTYQTPPADPYAFSASQKAPTASVPAQAPSAPAKKSSGSRYTVAKGDTLSGIARKKGTTVAKIRSANGLSSDLIRLGQSLKIP